MTIEPFDAAAWLDTMMALGRHFAIIDGRLLDVAPAGPHPPGGKDREIALYWQREAVPDSRALVLPRLWRMRSPAMVPKTYQTPPRCLSSRSDMPMPHGAPQRAQVRRPSSLRAAHSVGAS